MPTGTKGGYDKARETYAKENNSDKSNGGFFGGVGSSIDKGISSVKSGIGNLFSGGGKNSNSGGGGGADSGQQANPPSYGAMSLRGLTSSDPANFARNQAAAARYNAMPQRESENRGYMSRDKGIASLAPTVPAPAPVTLPTTPTTPVAPTPVGVPTTGYAGYDSSSIPAIGYGSAFAGLSQPMANPYGGMNLMDIFSMYPDLQYM
jgi:hypothetical protein